MTQTRLHTIEELGLDLRFAPGWSRTEALRRKAILVRVDDDCIWIAAVNPSDISVVDDLRWLTNRLTVQVLWIDLDTLRAALKLLDA